MKMILSLLLLLSTYAVDSQGLSNLQIGVSLGYPVSLQKTEMKAQNEDYLVLSFLEDAGPGRLQLEYQTNFTAHIIYLKMGFRIVRHGYFSWYVYLPPLHGKIGEGYNTPFNTELFYRYHSLNVDVYRTAVVPSLKLRFNIF